MELVNKINNLSQKIENEREHINTEEATKTAWIMPFIAALGYDVFNPLEVIPEYTCDIPGKKQEKIDYCIQIDNVPTILIECKSNIGDLNISHASQLFRYFTTSNARFAILTNGINYKFYTDLEKTNIMDEKPFLEINLLDLKDYQIEELKKFDKANFNTDAILETASDLKYTNAIKNLLIKELSSPDEDFVKLLTGHVYEGMKSQKIIEQFTVLIKRAFQQLINEKVNDKLKNALGGTVITPIEEPVITDSSEKSINTTEEEKEAYYIIKAIGSELADSTRIVMRDAQGYCAIIFDDNNRKPIVRLYFNTPSNLRLAFIKEDKSENRIPIAKVEDIYKYSNDIKEIIKSYIS